MLLEQCREGFLGRTEAQWESVLQLINNVCWGQGMGSGAHAVCHVYTIT